jgi:hypothetical protein
MTDAQTQEITYINNTSLHISNKNTNDNNATQIFIVLHKTTPVMLKLPQLKI